MSVTVVHCADFHLGLRPSADKPWQKERVREQMHAFYRMLEHCEEARIDLLLIAGDFFEGSNISTALLREVQDAFRKLTKTLVFITPGNHDYDSVDSPYRAEGWPENTKIFGREWEKVSLFDDTVHIYGSGFQSSYQERGNLEELKVETQSAINIVITHGQVVPPSGKSDYNPIAVDCLRNLSIDYLALGHIHKASGIQKAGAISYAYPGCPVGMGFDEIGTKSVLQGVVEKGKVHFTALELTDSRMRNTAVFFHGIQSVEEIDRVLEETFQSFGATDYVRLHCRGELSADLYGRLGHRISAFRGRVRYLEWFQEVDLQVDWQMLARENSFRGTFIKLLWEQYENAKTTGDAFKRKRFEKALRYGYRALEGEDDIVDIPTVES